jgi:hypothetical protein
VSRHVDLPCHPGSPLGGRSVLRELCADWDIPELLEPGEHVVTELVSNAVEHAHSSCRLTAAHDRRGLQIGVRDFGAGAVPRVRLIEVTAVRGRGLHMVAALSASWGVTEHADRKTGLGDPIGPLGAGRVRVLTAAKPVGEAGHLEDAVDGLGGGGHADDDAEPLAALDGVEQRGEPGQAEVPDVGVCARPRPQVGCSSTVCPSLRDPPPVDRVKCWDRDVEPVVLGRQGSSVTRAALVQWSGQGGPAGRTRSKHVPSGGTPPGRLPPGRRSPVSLTPSGSGCAVNGRLEQDEPRRVVMTLNGSPRAVNGGQPGGAQPRSPGRG